VDVPVGKALLGRVVDALGVPIDGTFSGDFDIVKWVYLKCTS
jgi:flagellar biosynthesis/type III secretory pathway ATPase